MHFRYYASSRGRFLKSNNIIPDLTNPQNWNAYTYVNNNPIVYLDPTGEVINLSKLTSNEQALLIKDLNEFTGNEYEADKEGNLQLVSVGENSSPTATEFLNNSISDTKVYKVLSVEGRNKWNDTGYIELNFSSFKDADYDKVNRKTFNLGSTFIHELFHGVTGLMDSDPATGAIYYDFGFKGPAVEFVNKIRQERGLPLRESYFAEYVGKGKIKIRFDNVDPEKPKKIFYVIRKVMQNEN